MQTLEKNGELRGLASALWHFPLVYLLIFLLRFCILIFFRPLFHLTRSDLTFREATFATIGGLRGSVSLIMAQALVVETPHNTGSPAFEVRPQWCRPLQGCSVIEARARGGGANC